MRKMIGKRMLCLLLAAVMLMAGCGKQESIQGQSNEDNSNEQQTTMGRYVETETDLPEQMKDIINFYQISDGKLAIVDRQGKILLSEDNGTTWESHNSPWIQEKMPRSYIMDIKMDSKGTTGIIYMENSGEGEEAAESISNASLQCVLLLPDETIIPVEFFPTGKEETIDRFWISAKDQYFVSTMEGNIYEVQEDGSSKLYLSTGGCPQMIQFQGNLMIIDGYDFDEPILYDMDLKEYVVDEVLSEFVKENYADRGFNGTGWHNICYFPGEDTVIYLAGKNGLHRHVIGGTLIEQVVDSKLSRLGNPQYGIMGMVFLETGVFLAVTNDGKLLKFTYDPNKESIPQEKLKIYSLKKNSEIYTAMSIYQIQNPDILIEYEFGMEEGEAVTSEDAIKKLNTQILAGEGPDLLMLDGLPIDSYIEKGMLSDLNDFVADIEKDGIFENLIRAFEKEDGIYAIPGQVQFPVMMGKENSLSKMVGLSAIADEIERMRENTPEKDLIGLGSEKSIMKLFAIVSAQKWKNQNEEIDKNAIAEFLIQTKRIYEAQINGLDEDTAKRLWQSNEYYVQNIGENWMYDLMNYGFFMDYAAGYSDTFVGINGSPRSYIDLISITKAENFEDAKLVFMGTEEGSIFIPKTIMGINATTSKMELAKDFLKVFLGKENQCGIGGYPVNKEAFNEVFIPKEEEIGENGTYGQIGVIDEDGQEVLLDVFVPTDDDITEMKKWMETAKIPYIEDTVFEQCVFAEGSKYILGEQALEDALNAIEEQIAIYIAE